MRQFAVSLPESMQDIQLIGKVVQCVSTYPTPTYRIRLLGHVFFFLLCSEQDRRVGKRLFRYKDIPHLQKDDVIEFSDGVGYVHFSVDSNDNCIVVSNECNERCINCPQLDKAKIPGLAEQNHRLIGFLPRATKTVALSGGEPTLDFPEFMRVIKAFYKRRSDLHIDILTNGLVLSDISKTSEMATLLRTDTSTFCITLYGDIPSIHDAHTRTPGSFAKLHTALHNLAYYRYSIELRFLITALNYMRLPSFIEYVYDNFPFVDHISLMGMEYSGDASKNADGLHVSIEEYSLYLVEAVRNSVMRDIPIFIYNHPVCLLPKILRKYAVASISDWKSGYYSLCGQCDAKGFCGGFFTTSNPAFIPKNIHPISLDYPGEDVV